MRTNKIHNADLFTQAANEGYQKHVKTQSKQALEVIKAKVDWKRLLKPIETSVAKARTTHSPAGRPRHDLLVIVKCFLLQAMYNLSDPRLEEEIADRRSFQIFLDLHSHDAIPDETTICRYRELFARLGLDKKLLKAFNRQLADLGLIVGKGTIIDASLKQAQATSASGRDHDAQYTSRHGEGFYGYKGHIGMDADTDIVHTVEFTTANIHDSHGFDELLLGSERSVWADKGYAQRERRSRLQAQGVRCRIMHKAYRAHPLTQRQKQQNRLYARVRSAVERPFAYLRRVLAYDRCRFYDLRRNAFQFTMAIFTYNIRRMITLTASARA